MWKSLCSYGAGCSAPWIVWGDFNNVLYPNERIGSDVSWSEIREFRQCLHTTDLHDAKVFGSFFTWNNKHEGGDRVFSRIDQVLVNSLWYSLFPDAMDHFLREGTFDHCPCVINLFDVQPPKARPFKYFNMWSMDKSFTHIVSGCWSQSVVGNPMF
ncbi:hypothetical protein RND81_08G020100 [Saponaria officinalis]|uniref:Exo_endo_phos domain-containing protein n=1 Tax=Saponaria officinalis TaxID=3572 RepID=A0AAW1J3M7_SAPOF